ncbi:exported hypothetical protein [Candidatus Sulfopaludibacter sp. SbA4]|nr:exported hypothetical protein [Candidatus Sulfopaludibacter sp. SbA4]
MSLPTKIQTTADLATIGVAVLLSAVLIKVYLVPASSPRVPPAAPPAVAATSVGSSLKGQLPGVDWSKNGRTLVLAISTQCHFCKESTPFYRRLEQEVGKVVKMVAVLPQPAHEAEQYLKDEGVQVDQVKQVSLGTIGVRGTPTILLVDSKGVVTKVWTGKLKAEEQEQVLGVLKKG